MDKDSLSVSEMFYSIQGEGPSMGRRAVFLRLKSCNLLCGGTRTVADKKLHDGATWRCDTIETWLKGTTKKHPELISDFIKEGFVKELDNNARLVVTGGEPLLQQEELTEFLTSLRQATTNHFAAELETNGTILPQSSIIDTHFQQINCSPKLSNSGIPKEKRIKPEVIKTLLTTNKTIFKFVVNRKEDIIEIKNDFLSNFQIKPNQVWLMPASSSREELVIASEFVVEEAKKLGTNFSSRLQLEIWDKAVGV